MITVQCRNGHIHKPADAVIADLNNGHVALGYCPECGIRTTTPLTEAQATAATAAGYTTPTGVELRILQDLYAATTVRAITRRDLTSAQRMTGDQIHAWMSGVTA